MIFGYFAVVATEVWGGDIVLSVEEPVSGSTYSGVANIRGWVVMSRGIDRVELYIDGQYDGNIPVGGKRLDVGATYPSYPNSANSGFSMAFNYSEKAAGSHNIRVRAIDADGAAQEQMVEFQVARFDNPFVADPSRVSLSNISISSNGQAIFYSMTVDGKSYSVRLDWLTATQGFALTQIMPSN